MFNTSFTLWFKFQQLPEMEEFKICGTLCFKLATGKVHTNWEVLKLNGTHQLLAYADDVNLLMKAYIPEKKKQRNILSAGKEIDLEVSAEKTEYMPCLMNRMEDSITT
jgi:hypothetical protein